MTCQSIKIKGQYMKKLDVRFDTEKVNVALDRVSFNTGKSKSEVARSAMNLGLKDLERYSISMTDKAIELIEEFK